MRLIPGWYRIFFDNIRNGVPEAQAAKHALVGQDKIIQTKRSDPEFVKQLEAAKSAAPKRWG